LIVDGKMQKRPKSSRIIPMLLLLGRQVHKTTSSATSCSFVKSLPPA
jgi:hypothetical protein